MSSTHRPPITCHVLDTTTGQPAPNLSVTLTLLAPFGPSAPLRGITNADGRVTSWAPPTSDAQSTPGTLEEIFQNASSHPERHGKMVWSLRFDTEAYYGEGNTFWPEVELKFNVQPGRDEHYHVPLLLGPYSYTTYRGS